MERAEVIGDLCQHVRQAGVEHLAPGAVVIGSLDGEQHRVGCVGRRGQRPDPDARPAACGSDRRGQARHVREARFAPAYGPPQMASWPMSPGERLPARVDHHGRAVVAGWGEFGQQMRVGQDPGVAVLPVDMIPIVGAVDRLGRHARGMAQHAAERLGCGEGGLACLTLSRDHLSRTQLSSVQRHARAAVANVEPQADPCRVHRPEAERAGQSAHAVAMRGIPIVGEEIPRHHSLGHQPAPLQITVTAFPGIAQEAEPAHRHG